MTSTLNWDLNQNNDRMTVRLFGELSRNTLLPLWRQRAFLSTQYSNSSIIEWNLTALTKIDSAGFVALCDFLNDGRAKANKTVCLLNAPQQIFTLADLVGLSDWIKLFAQN